MGFVTYERGNYVKFVGSDWVTAMSDPAILAMGADCSVFDRPPQDIVLSGTPAPNMWITFITDPDGVSSEFVERERSAFCY